MSNLILNTDSYKCSMFNQYPPKTTGVYSYIESRGGKFQETKFFGLQAFLKQYLLPIITKENIEEADDIITSHGEPFYRQGWDYILQKKGGRLPIVIRAVHEGLVIPVNNVLLTIENTDPNCFWLTTYLETALLRAVWYPTTVATQSYAIKKVITSFLEKNGNPNLIDYKLHDFGARGVSSEESAAIGGAAHLINFKGSDNVTTLKWIRDNYGSVFSGVSIPAMEHSTVTAWGKDNEADAYRNMLSIYAKPGAIVAAVSDSYDIYNAVDKIWGQELKQQVIDSGATIVIRPDSGDPIEVCQRIVSLLGDRFGYDTNTKGYKVLRFVRVIQGDGVNQESIAGILSALDKNGWSADNISFGMGGALLQQVNRDTQKFAMKCSAIERNGRWITVNKDPITDRGKTSKAGRVQLFVTDGKYESGVDKNATMVLRDVFRDGELLIDEKFDEIKAR